MASGGVFAFGGQAADRPPHGTGRPAHAGRFGRWLTAAAFTLLPLLGCGEGTVTGLVLPVVPDNGPQFIAAQQAMITLGCSIPGCHAAIVGNFKVTANPKDAATLDEEYGLAKALIDLDAPGESVLITAALAGRAGAGHPVCFADTEGCAWQVITAWIAGDPPADGIDCTPTANACFTGGD